MLHNSNLFFVAAAFKFCNFLATSCVAFLVKTAHHLQFTTQVYCLTLSLICPIDCFSNCRLWDSSSRRDSINACSEFLRSKFWISRSYSVKKISLGAEIFSKNSVLSSSLVFSDISFIRRGFSVTLKRLTPNTVPSTFPCHRLWNTDHRTFLSLCPAMVSRCMLSYSPWETCETEVSNIEGTPNCSVFSRVILEKLEVLSWFGSMIGVVSPTTEVIDLVELFGIKTCGVRGIGQAAKLLGARAEVRLTRAFRSGTVWQGSRGRRSREGGLEVTVREQHGRVKHESGEGEMERYNMRTEKHLKTMRVRDVCTPRKENVSEICACDTECVQTAGFLLGFKKWTNHKHLDRTATEIASLHHRVTSSQSPVPGSRSKISPLLQYSRLARSRKGKWH